MNIDPSTTKYLIKARITAEGVVEKPDVVGAIFGQTEGLLGDELDLRDLQKSGRIGRIEVDVDSKKGRAEGEILIPSSLDQVETAILAASLETIERVGPCKAKIDVAKIEDIRISKRVKIVERAKHLLSGLIEETKAGGVDITESVRDAVQVEEITSYGPDKCPAGPNIDSSEAVIVVEGRSDVLCLLKAGIKNAIAVEGTSVPKTIQNLSREKVVTAFVDGDRGGELILKELLQVAEIDFVTTAPKDKEVEELTQKQIMKCLRNKIPVDQYIEMYGLKIEHAEKERAEEHRVESHMVQKGEEKKRFFPTLKKKETPYVTKATWATGDIPAPEIKKETAQKVLSPVQLKYKEYLMKLFNSSKAYFVDSSGNVISEIFVRDLPDAVKTAGQNANGLILDGIITQRLLDLTSETTLRSVVGMKLGNVVKLPANITVLTKEDLE